MKRGWIDEAEKLFKAVLEKTPGEHHAMEGMVKVFLKRRQGEQAVEFAKRIVAKRRRRASYRLLYGDALALIGDRASAEKQWSEALRLSPEHPGAKSRLGKRQPSE
jgi:predicted Zn-dependent protease